MRQSLVLSFVTAVTAATCTMAPAEEKAVLKGHTGLVWAVAFSPDGKILASAGSDGFVILWDVRSGKMRACFQPFPNAKRAGAEPQFYQVHALAFSPNGKKLALGGGAVPDNDSNGQFKLWDVAAGKEDAVLKPVFPRWLCRFGMAFAPSPRKTQRFQQLPAGTTEEPNG